MTPDKNPKLLAIALMLAALTAAAEPKGTKS